MTTFWFEVDDEKGFDAAVESINAKWDSKPQVHQIVHRSVDIQGKSVRVSFESVFSPAFFQTIAMYTGGLFALTGLTFLLIMNNAVGWFILWLACILYFVLYIPVLLLIPRSLFSFFVKGLRKNGYKGKAEYKGGTR